MSASDISWSISFSEFVRRVRILRNSLEHAAEVELSEKSETADSVESEDVEASAEKTKRNAIYGFPPPDMCSTMLEMLNSALTFAEKVLSSGAIDKKEYQQLNESNFPRIEKCLIAAAKAHAQAGVRKIIEWRDLLSQDEWRDLYVVIPAVWAEDAGNPWKEMLEQLMDTDHTETHIITSEWPRNNGEARSFLGRVVGDRAIWQLVLGDSSHERHIKTSLSSEIDHALEIAGYPLRCHSNRNSLQDSMSAMKQLWFGRRMTRPSFC